MTVSPHEVITPEEAWERVVVQQRKDGWACTRSGSLFSNGQYLQFVCCEGTCESEWETKAEWIDDHRDFPSTIEWVLNTPSGTAAERSAQ